MTPVAPVDSDLDDIQTTSTTHEQDGTEKQPASTTTTPPATTQAAPAAENAKPPVDATTVASPADAPPKTDDDDEGPRDGETPQQTAARTRSRLQKRIDKLTGERYTAEGRASSEQQRADRLERELAEARRKPSDPPTPGGDAKPGAAPSTGEEPTRPQPKPEDFDTYEAFLDARDGWREEQREQKQQQAQAATAARERHTKVRERIESFKQRQPDYDAVMAQAAGVEIPAGVMRLMEESDHGAAIAYHLVKNPAQAAALFDLSPVNQVKTIGRLEANFERDAKDAETRAATPPAPTPPKPKPVSAAPDPIEPIAGPAASAKALDDMDTDEYVDEQNRREAAARRRR